MSQTFNYRHLYYFWVVAKEGGVARAAERLDMAVQTISAQVRSLEKDLGIALLRTEGRNLVLTDAGVAAMHEISESDAAPSVTRVSDANETRFSFSTRKKSKGLSVSSLVSKGLFKVLERRGWNLGAVCLSFVGYEGGPDHVSRQKSIVKKIVGKHGGIVLGKGGETIKAVSTAARAEIAAFMGRPVHLFLRVALRENWLDEAERYTEMGLDFRDGN